MLEDFTLNVYRAAIESIEPARRVVLHIDEKIPPQFGDRMLVSLYPGSFKSQVSPDMSLGTEAESMFYIGFTLRCGVVPIERYYSLLYAGDSGLVPIMRSVTTRLHERRHAIHEAINAQSLPLGYKLTEPFSLSAQVAEVRLVGPDHFYCDESRADPKKDAGFFASCSLVGGVFRRADE